MLTDILLIATGLGIICVSYVISEKVTSGSESKETAEVTLDNKAIEKLSEEQEQNFKVKISELFEKQSEEEIIKVDDQLSHISNEKIIAVTELSDQVLEKINQNHQEVVFLYNMLNEKETEMKDFIQEIDKSKVVLEELAVKELQREKELQKRRLEKQLREQKALEKQRAQKIEPKEEEKQTDIITENNSSAVQPNAITATAMLERQQEMLKSETASKPIVEEEVEEVNRLEENNKKAVNEPVFDEIISTETVETTETKDVNDIGKNNNQVILDLYKEGKSIMEIAKLLGKGQGEIKLVIDLFQGVK